jgi:hypothetical protein
MRRIARYLVSLLAVAPVSLGLGLGLVMTGCGGPLAELGGETTSGAVIGHLQGRDHKITLHASAEGPRFTVRAFDGTVLAAELTPEELSAQHPDLFRIYQDSVARPVDATLTLPSRSR